MIVTLARYFLIAVAVILAPFYGIWVFGGWIADRRAQCRSPELLKGDHQ